jgi:hypothetical protein
MWARSIVATIWRGPWALRRVPTTLEEQQAMTDALSDAEVERQLRPLVSVMPATPEERRTRLRAWPSQADLDAMADRAAQFNDGVRPTVRIISRSRVRRPVAT